MQLWSLSACNARPVTFAFKKTTIRPTMTTQAYQTMLFQRESDINQAYTRLLYELKDPFPASQLHPEFLAAVYAKQLADIKHTQADFQTQLKQQKIFLQTRAKALLQFEISSADRNSILQKLYSGNTSLAMVFLKKLIAEEPNVTIKASIHYELGQYYLQQIDYLPAFKHLQTASKLQPKASQWQNATQLSALKFSEPLKNSEIYLSELSNSQPPEEIDTVTSLLSHIGRYWFSKGKYDKALGYFSRALAIKTKTVGRKNPHYADTWLELGRIFDRKRDLDTATLCLEKALSIYKAQNKYQKISTSIQDKTAQLYAELGQLWLQREDHSKSLFYAREAIRIYSLGSNNNTTKGYQISGSESYQVGHYSEAKDYEQAYKGIPANSWTIRQEK